MADTGLTDGGKHRVLISTDIGGDDPDDFQSMVHLLVYSDVLDVEGLVSSPPYAGRKKDILEVIDAYEHDYPNLKAHSPGFPGPDLLRSVTKQGAVDTACEGGHSSATEGSAWIVDRAVREDARPLYVLAWGSLTDVAQAVHDEPRIKERVRLYSTGSWNTEQDPAARGYLYEKHADLWWIEADTTFRGVYMGGEQGGDLGNVAFVERHVKGHGALGDCCYSKKRDVKMGDTPSVLYVLSGDPGDPASDHWGGSFVPTGHGPCYWHDDPDPALVENGKAGAKTVNRWRRDYLRDWQKRMEWCVGA